MIQTHYDCPCLEKCPLNYTMSIIGGKWKMQIICSLNNQGTMRYNELRRKLDGISNTVLASSLKELEEEGLVKRKEYLEVPIRVEYSTTEMADRLMPILEELSDEDRCTGRGPWVRGGRQMRLVSWNVNGLRAVMGKNFMEFFNEIDADIFCLQETKLQEGQIEMDLPGYYQYWNYAEKKGYSGTAIFTKKEPVSVSYGIGIDEHDHEGRVITLEFDDFYMVTVYTPNSQDELRRLEYRMKWEDDFREYLLKLNHEKPVIVTGDMNVAHREIDLKNPKTNRRNAGFTDEERGKMTELLDSGFIDTFRYFYPDTEGIYSWWSYRFKAREKNAGWRIDYFLVSKDMESRLKDAKIHTEVLGSDHCPVELEID